ncbi:hypothetical protein [Agromyces silvae]|uniref:hypothetical protein n=1 Tax=Agromyces silvae TaxID=3388266 RepID=UPI00280AEF55|nr:hypothetical protein [Agromyces protaetiae]
MPNLHAGLLPGPEATRLAAAAARHRAELDAFLAEVEGGLRVMLPTGRCLAWRSTAAEAYEARLHDLRTRLGAAAAVLADACESQHRQATRLQVIADAPGAG